MSSGNALQQGEDNFSNPDYRTPFLVRCDAAAALPEVLENVTSLHNLYNVFLHFKPDVSTWPQYLRRIRPYELSSLDEHHKELLHEAFRAEINAAALSNELNWLRDSSSIDVEGPLPQSSDTYSESIQPSNASSQIDVPQNGRLAALRRQLEDTHSLSSLHSQLLQISPDETIWPGQLRGFLCSHWTLMESWAVDPFLALDLKEYREAFRDEIMGVETQRLMEAEQELETSRRNRAGLLSELAAGLLLPESITNLLFTLFEELYVTPLRLLHASMLFSSGPESDWPETMRGWTQTSLRSFDIDNDARNPIRHPVRGQFIHTIMQAEITRARNECQVSVRTDNAETMCISRVEMLQLIRSGFGNRGPDDEDEDEDDNDESSDAQLYPEDVDEDKDDNDEHSDAQLDPVEAGGRGSDDEDGDGDEDEDDNNESSAPQHRYSGDDVPDLFSLGGSNSEEDNGHADASRHEIPAAWAAVFGGLVADTERMEMMEMDAGREEEWDRVFRDEIGEPLPRYEERETRAPPPYTVDRYMSSNVMRYLKETEEANKNAPPRYRMRKVGCYGNRRLPWHLKNRGFVGCSDANRCTCCNLSSDHFENEVILQHILRVLTFAG